MYPHSKILLRYKKVGFTNTHNTGEPQSHHVERKKQNDSIYVKNKINVNSQCDERQISGSQG